MSGRAAFILMTMSVGAILGASPVQAQTPVAHAVLFYSPACPHCRDFITQDLPVLLERFGGQLEILALDTGTLTGAALFRATVALYSIPGERQGVPMLIVGDVVLMGSVEIPEELPTLVEQGLAAGGIAWPDIPGLQEAIATAAATSAETAKSLTPTMNATPVRGTDPTRTPVSPGSPASEQTLAPLSAATDLSQAQSGNASSPFGVLTVGLARDPLGNGLSIAVLAGMMGVMGVVTLGRVTNHRRTAPWRSASILALCALGLVVAGYLSYVEITQTQAVCGPVGDCNTVQQSAYARLFGLVPVGLLGLAGYLAIATSWGLSRRGGRHWADWATLAAFALSFAGAIFSVYLTFLELFVIGATCAWCLASSALISTLLWLTAPAGRRSLGHLSASRHTTT